MPELTASEFRSLLDLYMVSDPWPLDPEDDENVGNFLSRVAKECDEEYDGWVEAYHEFEVDDVKV